MGSSISLPGNRSTIDTTMSPHATATVWSNADGTLWIAVEWVPWASSDLHGGDQ
jgi:hypothetical protein